MLQFLISIAEPSSEQSSPLSGGGLVHVLVRFILPPEQLLLQALNFDHEE